jgi:excisionase family DNA binding protein
MTTEARIQALFAATPETLKMVDAVLSGDATKQPERPASVRLCSMGESCERLNVSRPTLWRLIQAGRIQTVELRKGSKRVPESELLRFVGGK